MDEELQTAMVHPARLGERECLSNEARQPLSERVVPPFDMASFAFFLARGLVLVLWNHSLVGFPKITVAA